MSDDNILFCFLCKKLQLIKLILCWYYLVGGMAIYETLILVTNIEVGTENPRISELRKLNSLFFLDS